MNKFTGWLASLACAGLLAACGGGGGSPGTNSSGVAPSKAASVTLTADATTIASSGLDGTEVTLTAIVKDSGGNALVGETVSFSTSSGTITSTNRTTNTSGQVVEKLSVKGDSSLRTITITASAGNAKSSAITVQVVNAVPTLTLTADSGTLPSGGTKDVTVTALVRDANNNVVPNITVSLKSDSGSLSVTNAVTNAQGVVTGTLGIGGDATSRDIKVSASVTGAAATPIVVRVSGNVLTLSAAPSISVGASTDVTVKLVDSAGNPLVGKPVTYSSNANSLTVKDGGSAVTNSGGQLVLSYTASGGTADVVSVKAMGELASTGITINSSTFAVRVLDGSGNVEASAAIGGCQQVAVTNAPGSSVTISTSRGTVYSNASCSAALSGALGLSGGAATAYVNATGPGVATLTANAGGQTTQTVLEFYAPVTSVSTITLQVDPAIIGTNAAGSTSEQATLRAVVRDGTAQNNLVKNATVSFSILSDPSGGKLTEPSVATTGADGAASTNFIAGSSVTPTGGVRIQARLIGGSNAAATATLTVAQKSLFISAGTGNTVLTPSSTTYQMDYVVIVTDATGNAVRNVNLTAAVLPTFYYKGALAYTAPTGPWEPVSRTACANEDLNNNGILDAGEDFNGNGVLDPGIPVTVTPTVTTDSTGRATVSLVYPRDRVYWLDVNLTIQGATQGTESRYTSLVHLIGLSGDYSSQNVRPPGATSPYGVSTTCSNPQ
ncbi:Ig-like group 1 domain-containing protein [Duganella dendranthematis]|uniref:Ig-like group 1 domain-containing protein n=1 Tax=Duganella dendranthematis TaxID=2728021 RepID=A0ABX6MAR6_9BURK|nr:Ig-like domain-containing protein [Duganella dendranthematis]QJD91002.1 Ig-like group 1 domain-containing protein [Duganella dendranthematis]